MQVTAILTPAEEGGFVAFNPETGSTTQGETVEIALANLREAVELYLEEFPIRSVGAPFVTTFDVALHA
ncbi:type II toxin-antitoxin system HicB family antitoxin [Sphingomonas sp.]|jgi:predicted RNase H-like HicB family nuclease|uniref:type II toxin-antitoxin system HicB family antitoxin n=1 Tax=Sphingomonas sp. TaxID=28214 RepID=UPI0025E2E76C|nr:type II toxin-antitoxin system HicB family antitoxin [Sphingomonas sp.]